MNIRVHMSFTRVPLIALLALLCVQTAYLQAQVPVAAQSPSASTSETLPLAMLYLRTPGRPWEASESPILTMYDDGRVIVPSKEADDSSPAHNGPQAAFRSGVLNASEKAELLASLAHDQFDTLPQVYFDKDSSIEVATGKPNASLILRKGGEIKYLTIHAFDPALNERSRRRFRNIVAHAIEIATKYSNPRFEPWLPDEVTVALWPMINAEQPPVPWPDSIRYRQAESGGVDQTTLKVQSKNLAAILELDKRTATPNTPILFEGKKVTMAWRFPVPGEDELNRRADIAWKAHYGGE